MKRPASPLAHLPASLLLALLLGPGCGASSLGAYLDLAFERNGAGDMATVASVIVLDADPAPATMGLDRAGVSALESPALLGALEVCVLEEDPGGKVGSLRLLDPGVSTLRGPQGEQELDPVPPAFGEGTVATKRFESDEIPYQPGGAYELSCAGAEAPLFAANLRAPPDYQVEQLGFVTPGPGTATLPSTTDLDLVWSPGSDEDDMVVVIRAGNLRLSCRARDDGSFKVKGKLMKKLPQGPGTLALERVRRVALDRAPASDGRLVPALGRVALRSIYDIELQ